MKGRCLACSALSYAVWVLLAPTTDPEFLLAGLVISVPLGWLLGTYAFEGPVGKMLEPKRWWFMLLYLLILVKEIVIAGVFVTRIVFKRELAIRPGVVAVQTRLSKRWELTLLANSITLTPGTFFLDLDERSKTIYVHWITMRSEALDEVKRMIAGSYERMLSKVFG